MQYTHTHTCGHCTVCTPTYSLGVSSPLALCIHTDTRCVPACGHVLSLTLGPLMWVHLIPEYSAEVCGLQVYFLRSFYHSSLFVFVVCVVWDSSETFVITQWKDGRQWQRREAAPSHNHLKCFIDSKLNLKIKQSILKRKTEDEKI